MFPYIYHLQLDVCSPLNTNRTGCPIKLHWKSFSTTYLQRSSWWFFFDSVASSAIVWCENERRVPYSLAKRTLGQKWSTNNNNISRRLLWQNCIHLVAFVTMLTCWLNEKHMIACLYFFLLGKQATNRELEPNHMGIIIFIETFDSNIQANICHNQHGGFVAVNDYLEYYSTWCYLSDCKQYAYRSDVSRMTPAMHIIAPK